MKNVIESYLYEEVKNQAILDFKKRYERKSEKEKELVRKNLASVTGNNVWKMKDYQKFIILSSDVDRTLAELNGDMEYGIKGDSDCVLNLSYNKIYTDEREVLTEKFLNENIEEIKEKLIQSYIETPVYSNFSSTSSMIKEIFRMNSEPLFEQVSLVKELIVNDYETDVISWLSENMVSYEIYMHDWFTKDIEENHIGRAIEEVLEKAQVIEDTGKQLVESSPISQEEKSQDDKDDKEKSKNAIEYLNHRIKEIDEIASSWKKESSREEVVSDILSILERIDYRDYGTELQENIMEETGLVYTSSSRLTDTISNWLGSPYLVENLAYLVEDVEYTEVNLYILTDDDRLLNIDDMFVMDFILQAKEKIQEVINRFTSDNDDEEVINRKRDFIREWQNFSQKSIYLQALAERYSLIKLGFRAFTPFEFTVKDFEMLEDNWSENMDKVARNVEHDVALVTIDDFTTINSEIQAILDSSDTTNKELGEIIRNAFGVLMERIVAGFKTDVKQFDEKNN